MAWLDDYSVDFTTGAIRRVAGTTRYPIIDMHRGLMTLTGQATASGDDLGDISNLFVPSKRASDTDITLNFPMNIDDTAARGMYGGSITYANGDEKYSGLAIGGQYNADALPQVFQNNIKLTNYWGFSYSPDAALGYACRILVKSRTGGVDIDGGRVRVQSRGYGYIYREASTVLGSNESVASLGTISTDSFNLVDEATVATYADITNNEGYQTVDYQDGNGPQPYHMLWTKGSRSKGDVYNRVKYETRDGSAETLYGLNGEFFRGVTHGINVDTPTGTLIDGAEITWANGTGQLIAMNSPTAATRIYIQLLTGVAPVDNDVLTAGGTVTVNVTVEEFALGVESVAGNYTGSWIGARGAGQTVADISNTDSFVDLLGASHAPPNFQSASVGGLVPTEDRIILGKSIDGGDSIDKSEYASAVGNNNGNGTLVVDSPISNVPTAGWVRISNGQSEDSYQYSSYSGSTFTLTGTLSTNYGTGVDVYPVILDKVAVSATESAPWIYTVDTDLAGQVVDDGSVNDTPTIPFPLSGTFSSSGFSANIVRTPDA